MIKIKEIEITRAEGPSELCDIAVKAVSFLQAKIILLESDLAKRLGTDLQISDEEEI